MQRIVLNIWGPDSNPKRIVLTGSTGPRGVPQFSCEISSEATEQSSGQEQEAKRFDLDQKMTDRVQLMLDDLTIKGVPPHSEADSMGINYMLKMEDGFQSVTYVWSGNSPKGWEHLQALANLMLELAESDSA